MTMTAMTRLAAAVVLASAGAARGDAVTAAEAPVEPDPAVEEAGDANLESTANRSGLTVSGSLGAGMIIGLGIKDSVGRGGAVALRLGHVATPRTVITFEGSVTAALHQPKGKPVQTNNNVNLLAGAQYYVNQSLWLRFAGGLGVYQARDVLLAPINVGDMPAVRDLTLVGPAALVGIGLDVARFKWAVLGFETATSAMINSDGVLIASSINLGLSFD